MPDEQIPSNLLVLNVARAEESQQMELLLIVLVILLLFGGIGTWPSFGYHQYGYGPKSNHMTLAHVNCRDPNPTGLSEQSTVPILYGLI